MIPAWKNPPPDLRLSNRFVDIWHTRLDLPNNEVDTYLSVLCSGEIERADRFKVKRKYREYVITRGLLRKALGHALDCPPECFQFKYTEHAKPFLQEDWGGLPVSFNVTHSHNQALIAMTLDRNIGIDIEKIRHDVNFRKLARRFFSTTESSELNKLQPQDLPAAFFACWTRKEAFVKALGDGIAFGLSEFSVAIDPAAKQVSLTTHWAPAQATKWSLINMIPGHDYIAALAVEGDNYKIRHWKTKLFAAATTASIYF